MLKLNQNIKGETKGKILNFKLVPILKAKNVYFY
jgi:hypothetical protein